MKLSTDNLYIGSFINEQLEPILPTYPVIADKGATGDYCVFRRTSFVAKNTKDVYNYEETITIEIIAVSNTYKGSIALAQSIKDKLENYRGKWKNTLITSITMDNTNEDWVNDNYLQRLYFTINIDNKARLR